MLLMGIQATLLANLSAVFALLYESGIGIVLAAVLALIGVVLFLGGLL